MKTLENSGVDCESTRKFVDFYRKNYPNMVNFAARIVRNEYDAEDVVQNTVEYLYRRGIRLYDSSKGSMKTWVYTALRTRALDNLKSLNRKHETGYQFFKNGSESAKLEGSKGFNEGDGSVDLINLKINTKKGNHAENALDILTQKEANEMNRETADAILKYVISLAPASGDMFRLSVFNEQTYKEISEQKKIPIGTVKSRINRVRNRIRVLLGSQYETAA